MTWPRGYADFEGSIVHHTAGSNSYTKAQVPATIRGIYSYHANTREWGDIGYNVLIDKYGGRWEGRSGTLASPQGKVVTGAHAAPRNRGTLGVSVLGTYDNSNLPTPLVLETFSDVIAARFAIAGVDPSSRGTMSVPSGTGAALSAGSVLPRISGHKDVKATSCPGSIYGYLDQIRSRVAAKYAQLGGPLPECGGTFSGMYRSVFRLRLQLGVGGAVHGGGGSDAAGVEADDVVGVEEIGAEGVARPLGEGDPGVAGATGVDEQGALGVATGGGGRRGCRSGRAGA